MNLTILTDFIYSLIAILMALLLGAFLILLSGYDVSKAYLCLFQGAFGNFYNISQTLLKMIPLIFTGLAVAIGFKSGLFNIGGEGQLYWGAFVTAVVSLAFPNANGVILIPLALSAGAIAGGIWGVIPGYLKAKTGAHEVVTTIMMNYIGIFATSFLLRNFFKEPGPIDQTAMIPKAVRLAELIPHTRLTWAIFLGIGVIIIIDLFFKKTALGYNLQTVGENQAAAEYAGINPKKMIVISMTICGMAAGRGYIALAANIFGQWNPFGGLLASYLFAYMDAVQMRLQGLNIGIANEIIQMLPYILTIIVLSGAVIRSRPPASLGKHYETNQ
jgi:simple sugar transport system permease protein